MVRLCVGDGVDMSMLKLPAFISVAGEGVEESARDDPELEELVTAQHLMILSCTLLSQRSRTFRDTLRTVGGIAGLRQRATVRERERGGGGARERMREEGEGMRGERRGRAGVESRGRDRGKGREGLRTKERARE